MGANSNGWGQIMRDRLDLDLPVPEIVDAIVGGDGRALSSAAERPGSRAPTRPSGGWPRPACRSALASSAHRAVIDAALDALGIAELLKVVVSSDQVAHGKPAPDVYLLAAARLGVDPADCLVVEDSLNGVLAGRAAGMTVALIPNESVPPGARCPGGRHRSCWPAWPSSMRCLGCPPPSDFLRYSTRPDEVRGDPVGATGLAANPKEYRARLEEQDDDQLDAWASELMRDIARRRGVLQGPRPTSRRPPGRRPGPRTDLRCRGRCAGDLRA